ncbi:MAG: LysM peptidoglycan-binding domain-containing protein [Oscillospiraceae bacterium]|jgi:hypothetical protein|nr:LysM peptidoglycan-binding domain-containing protein [Oscillospiraceae bacterium]
MEKACIVVLDDKEKETSRINFDFNPADFTVDYAPKYADAKGVADAQGKTEFIGEGSSTLSLKMTLDGFPANSASEKDAKDISGKVKALRELVRIKPDLHKPPGCTFEWGTTKYSGHITALNVNFTMFTAEGKPVRATVSITIQGKKGAKPGLESPDRTKRRVLGPDTPLYLVAFDAYNDCGEWRRIAAANGIRNPRRVQAGMVLKIPPIEKR